MTIADFVFEQANDEEMRRLRDSMNYLVGSITQELTAAQQGVEILYRQHYRDSGETMVNPS